MNSFEFVMKSMNILPHKKTKSYQESISQSLFFTIEGLYFKKIYEFYKLNLVMQAKTILEENNRAHKVLAMLKVKDLDQKNVSADKSG